MKTGILLVRQPQRPGSNRCTYRVSKLLKVWPVLYTCRIIKATKPNSSREQSMNKVYIESYYYNQRKERCESRGSHNTSRESRGIIRIGLGEGLVMAYYFILFDTLSFSFLLPYPSLPSQPQGAGGWTALVRLLECR